jgi:hypothetical protein
VVSSSPAAVELINKFAPTVQVSALLVVGGGLLAMMEMPIRGRK